MKPLFRPGGEKSESIRRVFKPQGNPVRVPSAREDGIHQDLTIGDPVINRTIKLTGDHAVVAADHLVDPGKPFQAVPLLQQGDQEIITQARRPSFLEKENRFKVFPGPCR